MSFEPHRHAERRRQSAITLINAILPLDLYMPHKRQFLSNCLWKLTMAEGRNKYALRYRSRASRRAAPKDLRHEHVIPRKKMVDELLRHPDQVDKIAADAVGCVVTRAEHEKLARIDKEYPDATGWERYELAKIVVIDMETGKPKKL